MFIYDCNKNFVNLVIETFLGLKFRSYVLKVYTLPVFLKAAVKEEQ